MLDDVKYHPDRYEELEREKLEALLNELTSGTMKPGELTGEDEQLLSRATIEYATAPKTSKLEEGRKQLVAATKKVIEKARPEMPSTGDVPDMDMPAFWWLQ